MKDEIANITEPTISITDTALHFQNNRLYIGVMYSNGCPGQIDVTEEVAEAISQYIKQ